MQTNLKISAIALIVAMLAAAPAHALTLNLGGTGSGGVVSLGGTNTDPTVDVLTNSTASGAPNGTANTNALNNGGGPTTADLTLGGAGTDGTNGNVLLDLFGSGGNGSDAAVALGSGTGTDGGTTLDLFDNGGGTGTGGTGSGDDVFGPAGGNGGPNNGLSGNGVRIASLDTTANARCFAPDSTQIARLTNRHDYDQATLSSWVEASSVSIVNTGLCSSAKSAISHDANVGRLQAFISGDPAIKSVLAKQGRSASDVIALDRKGGTLVVYVS